jgi:hypothetical protein
MNKIVLDVLSFIDNNLYEELTIDIENTFDRINFCVGDNILIYKDYRGQILEIDDIQVGTILNPQIINN